MIPQESYNLYLPILPYHWEEKNTVFTYMTKKKEDLFSLIRCEKTAHIQGIEQG